MGVRVFVIHRPISREEIGFPLEPKQTGAILEYFRIVRNEEAGDAIRAVRFEADREDLRAKLHHLANRVAGEYGLLEFECFHRVGEVPSGEPSLLIRLAAAHYPEANHAMNDFLESLWSVEVHSVPIPA